MVNHLVFVIHGIGEHQDFKDNAKETATMTTTASSSHSTTSGASNTAKEHGENFIFRDLFRSMQETLFR
jgi:hypothetical protein